ncbi:hypothetical protein Vi05172_g4803 [Venturia inaequalis]|nr:hypothetical protein Vi05172_g4803 [Venturia inaequalis]
MNAPQAPKPNPLKTHHPLRKSPRYKKIKTPQSSRPHNTQRSFRISKPPSKNSAVKKVHGNHHHDDNKHHQQPKACNLFKEHGAVQSHATTHRSLQTLTHDNTVQQNDDGDGSAESQNAQSSSPGIPSLFDLTGRTPIHAPTPDPNDDPNRCTNLLPQPANNSNPFYHRPVPGGPRIGPHPTIPLLSGGVQIFLLDRSRPFEPYPVIEPTAHCTNRLGMTLPNPTNPDLPPVPITLLPCLAHQILNAAPFNLNIPVCTSMICTPCSAQNRHNYSQIKEAACLGVCGVCYRRESKPQGNLNNTGQPTIIKPSWDCVCQEYPDVNSGEAICATHVERYALEVQTRAQLCADYRRQICRLDPKKPNKKNHYKKAPPPMRYINTTYWRHKNPPDGLPPWPPTAAHPRNEQDWYPVPNCPCGRPARHTRRGEANRIRSCAVCMQIQGDPPLNVANPRPMTVQTNAGIHIGRGVKVPEKTFLAGPYTGKSYGTEGWVRR